MIIFGANSDTAYSRNTTDTIFWQDYGGNSIILLYSVLASHCRLVIHQLFWCIMMNGCICKCPLWVRTPLQMSVASNSELKLYKRPFWIQLMLSQVSLPAAIKTTTKADEHFCHLLDWSMKHRNGAHAILLLKLLHY